MADESFIVPRDGLSHVKGAGEPPLSTATVGGLLAATAARFPDRRAAVFPQQGIRWTWREFLAEVDAFAAGLAGLGLAKGDRVAIWSPNRAEWVVTQFATARLGLILVNINPAYQRDELAHALGQSGCRAIVTAEGSRGSDYIAMLRELVDAGRLPALEILIRMGEARTPGMLGYAEVLAHGQANDGKVDVEKICVGLGCHEPINIQYTSGTTGSPKGATLTHSNIVNNGLFVAAGMRFTEQDCLCIPVPLYHCFGMVLAVLACVGTGAGMVFPSEVFDPRATLAATSEEHCTALHGVPTMFIAELAHEDFSSFDLSSLRTGLMAGAPCPIETMRRVVSEMHQNELTIAYGMTETSPVSFQSSTHDPLERRVSTVGRIQPHLEAKVVDTDGKLMPLGERGELLVRGYSVMLGYWNDEARTREVLVDGWMHTGDLVTIDAEGYCNVVGRVKDMLIRGGENVYPREIEEFLFRHPAVQTVQVFGVPDQKYGEEVCAWIILKAGATASEDDVRDFCRGQIAHFKIPRYIRFVKELPMTVSGKPQKFIMRNAMMEELGLRDAQAA